MRKLRPEAAGVTESTEDERHGRRRRGGPAPAGKLRRLPAAAGAQSSRRRQGAGRVITFCVLCVLCVLCGWPPAVAEEAPKKAPGWIGKRSHYMYPPELYLIGVGVSDESGTLAEKRAAAQARARAEIAKQIRVRVRSVIRDSASEAEGGGESVSHSVIRSMSRSTVDLEIEGILTAETYLDEAKELAYALGVLDRARADLRTREKIDVVLADAEREYKLGRKLEADPARSPLEHYFRAKGLLLRAQRLLGLVRGLGGRYIPQGDWPETSEVLAAIERVIGPDEKLDLDGILVALAYRVTRAVDPDLRILVGRFTYQDTRFAGPFSLYLSLGLDSKLPSIGGARVVDRRSTARRLAALAGASDLNKREDVGRAVDADAVLDGNYQELGKTVVVRAHLSDIDGQRLASAEVKVGCRLLDEAGLALVPPNYERLKAELVFIDPSLNPRPSGLAIAVSTDRGDGGVYRAGEKMFVLLKANRDCYVRLVYQQADDTALQIFPTDESYRRIRGGRGYVIPAETDDFEFAVCPPFGGELLKAFASTGPLPPLRGRDIGNGIVLLRKGASAASVTRRMRGIIVQQKEAEFAEAMCQVTTVAGMRDLGSD